MSVHKSTECYIPGCHHAATVWTGQWHLCDMHRQKDRSYWGRFRSQVPQQLRKKAADRQLPLFLSSFDSEVN